MQHLTKLAKMRKSSGEPNAIGLDETTVQTFLDKDQTLATAIDQAASAQERLLANGCDWLGKSEFTAINELQQGYVNFYSTEATNPYIALAAKGPWIISAYGAVIHDSGGYGMLGFGHDPENIRQVLNQPHVMANIMTAQASQQRFCQTLKKEIGHKRQAANHPFSKFICMNSGSEAVTVAARISDLNAKLQTDTGGRYAGRNIRFLAHKGGFHGRTDRPAQASDSTLGSYQILASFRDRDNLSTVDPNDIAGLKDLFAKAEQANIFYEMMFLEPVMGEGDPGKAMTREFYDCARSLCNQHGTLLLVDSIQAGLRAWGCLSIVDYPGFETCEPPDLETYSKALNAGQFPLSVLALNEKTAALYRKGIYGNTMTTNPRGLDVACAVLKEVTPELRQNIHDRGQEFIAQMTKLQKDFPDVITKVQGTGLLCSAFINPKSFKVTGQGQLEEYLRKIGIGVIHGGENALRFTPHFRITSAEISLIVEKMREAFSNGPRL